jgi:hypothetical protein
LGVVTTSYDMKALLKRIKNILDSLTRVLLRIVQKVLLVVLLSLLYVVGIGLTLALAVLFDRRLLGRTLKGAPSFWIETEGYQADRAGLLRQS